MPTIIIADNVIYADTKASLKTKAGVSGGTKEDNYIAAYCLEVPCWYLWNSESTNSDDGLSTLEPTAFTGQNGRWEKQ